MFRKSLLFSLFLLIAASVGVFAQSAPVTGTVELLKADGTREPVAGALVEAFRTDIKAGSPPAKTNAKGQFSFAGLQIGWTFVLSVSGPGLSPNYLPNVRAGQEKLLITVVPGDGSKMPEAEVRKNVAAGKAGGTQPTAVNEAEAKKAQAEYDAQVKEVTSKNEKSAKTNEIVFASLKAGNEAFATKNYDMALAKYDEGIAADPQFVGSAPILLNNRSTALMSRGVDTYNKAVKATDVTEKVASLTQAKRDLADSAEGFVKSWNILKNAQAADIGDKANYDATKLNAVRGAKDTFYMAVRTEQVDPAVIEAAKVILPEYFALETDAAKKAQAELILADLYRVVGDSENAIAAYRKVLASSPDNQDAMSGAGLSLVNQGYIELEAAKTADNKPAMEEAKKKLQEGSNLLAKFAAAAPDTNKYKADAVALIETLKKEQNVAPQKVTPAKKKP